MPLKRSGKFWSRLQGTLFCCFRCCKGDEFWSQRYYETHYLKIETGHWQRRLRRGGTLSADENDGLTESGDIPSGYGSIITDGSEWPNSGGGRTQHSAEQQRDSGVIVSRTSTASRLKARLRHRQIRAKHGKNGNVGVPTHLTATPGQLHEHRLLPKEKIFHEMARTGNLPEVEKMIKDRINVNCMDEKDRSALHLAAGQGHVEVVKSLLDNDANVDAADKFGMNALLWAAWFGQKTAIEALCNGGALVKAENKQGLTIVHCAASRGHVDILRYIVENLLEEDSMDSDDDESGLLPSFGAVQGKMTGLFGAAASYVGLKDKKSQEDATKKNRFRPESSFLEQRCTGQSNKTPLHLAAENGRLEATEYLIQVKCNKLARTSDGSTALHLAAKRGHIEMVNLLLENNLEIDIRNQEGMTPLLYAAEEGHANVVDLLLRQKADCNVKANEKRKVMAAVHFAAQNNHSSVIKVLCNFGVDLDAQCQGGNTAIHLAAIANQTGALETLIAKGANVNVFNDKKRVALHEATENNLTDVVETLLIAGAWVNQIDKNGKTALMMAARAENITITDMIIKASRYFTKRKNENRPYIKGKERVQFRKESTEEQRQMKPILWKLAMKQLSQADATRLVFYWGFSAEQIKAVQTQYTGPKSWKEHTYRMLLIWLHGMEENPLRGLYEGLVAIERKSLAESIRKKANQKLEGKDGCSIS
ncbi:ankyrin repeat and death domain-containing protein 1A-like isoform X2 [Acanthaster planci]|uniref:Ankyrin repeat and death domain-containing protein 1A-like isoform X2 n=1 Tax=Acanthaster planci TaxID=133434 RepID=A0A8B7ZMQ5_ACAPL|nr:ankyrin repeat and death domain-containing protein 1A-like isoform X2 [Acanthaster planci]